MNGKLQSALDQLDFLPFGRQSGLMATQLSDQQLMDFSREHLMHELSMLWQSERALRHSKQGSVEYVALLESFATHVRNLIEFFYFKPSGDYVRACEFFDDPAGWSPSKPGEINKLYSRASNEVSHLTTARISGNPPEKEWRTGDALTLIATVAKDFASKASPKKLHPIVIEFLQVPTNEIIVWIDKNVSHASNVHSQVVTVMGGFSASTATVIPAAVSVRKP